jgi:hypothetical protein
MHTIHIGERLWQAHSGDSSTSSNHLACLVLDHRNPDVQHPLFPRPYPPPNPHRSCSCLPRVGRLSKMPDPTLLGIGFTERSSAVAEFANLRSKHVSGSEVAVLPDQEMVVLPVRRSTDELPLPEVPIELLDGNAIRLPISRSLPVSQHRYLASMDVIQKQRLVRSLRTVHCYVDLVERDTLGGVDIIIDPHTAILFVSLLSLPSQCMALVTRLGEQS